jgi:hypothetical protein
VPGSDDKFDEMRRAWITAHQRWSTIQRRRAELLGRKVRARLRAVAAAVPDPHDDTTIPPLWLRTSKSPASQVELLGVVVVALLVPLGWLGGWLLNKLVTLLIPGTLRAYPIAALLWSGAVLGLCIAAFYDPGPSLGQIVLTPWLCAQVAATPFVAGVYGVAEGWLAVSGSDQWWPLTPPKRPMSAEDATLILGPYDTTGPGLLDAQPLPGSGERSQPR